jgi:catechol 2,3-dioxygenase
MDAASTSAVSRAIHPAARPGPLTLRVADAGRSLRFYREVLGFRHIEEATGLPVLGAVDAPLLFLKETPGAIPAPRASGLYHFAVLVPSRADLGHALRRLIEAKIPIGEADHLVSEALYLSDPDGNGIEVYRDRPRSQWKWNGGSVVMATNPLELDGLLREAETVPDAPAGLPEGTRIGHIHLQVSDVQQAVRFYHEVLGFDIMASLQGAAFLSAGGYHHHLGLNSWGSRGAPPALAGSTGIESFVIRVPNAEEQGRIAERVREAGAHISEVQGIISTRDPWNIGIDLEIEEGGKT